MKDFGERLRSLRKEKNLSQPELAMVIGVSRGMISFWENNINEPAASYIIKLAKHFGVTSDYLLGLEND